MYGSSICVGGLTRDTRQNVRLLKSNGEQPTLTDDFQIGQVWEMEWIKPSRVEPPHFEDVWVTQKRFVRQLTNQQVKETLQRYVSPIKGGIEQLYQRKLVLPPTLNASTFIAQSNIPDHSTTFWQCPVTLELVPDRENRPYYRYRNDGKDIKIKFVGFDEPASKLMPGTLLRMSLARWFDQWGRTEPRCYLQLSGWY